MIKGGKHRDYRNTSQRSFEARRLSRVRPCSTWENADVVYHKSALFLACP